MCLNEIDEYEKSFSELLILIEQLIVEDVGFEDMDGFESDFCPSEMKSRNEKAYKI